MERLFKLLAIFPLLLLAACPGQLPSIGILAPEDLAGYEMDATGMEGSYYYTFSADGTYTRVTTRPSGVKTKPFEGTWKWDRKTVRSAELILDEELTVTLNFTTREHANASIPSSERLYPVEFSAPR
ncbi:MAG: DUF4923 family protein [Akkermansiaceae bacterium]|jgi:hypothetical protein|nr:DUF4923 family protein [Akkermansiaceae bacterium]MDP4645519.1 DUF4923 family protein [Akkermansiaceae bacterium]MDP4719862.1 DUF4923 family protein [Akkermansiaceae bacterium]MDP4778674.1 DUF4923 family protein [Akkermansiaceae bacterium]MDP4848266.1 DUF4923 family protein [Akkermansiaceae bacterium]